jgi:hypothetical protein
LGAVRRGDDGIIDAGARQWALPRRMIPILYLVLAWEHGAMNMTVYLAFHGRRPALPRTLPRTLRVDFSNFRRGAEAFAVLGHNEWPVAGRRRICDADNQD